MRFILSLAWKNLSRYKRRTLITAGHCVHSSQMGGWADSVE